MGRLSFYTQTQSLGEPTNRLFCFTLFFNVTEQERLISILHSKSFLILKLFTPTEVSLLFMEIHDSLVQLEICFNPRTIFSGTASPSKLTFHRSPLHFSKEQHHVRHCPKTRQEPHFPVCRTSPFGHQKWQ